MAAPNEFAEQAVLGLALCGVVQPLLALMNSDFLVPRHQVIAAVVRDLVRQGTPTDPIVVGAELESRAQLAQVGGRVYVMDLVALAPPGGDQAGGYWARVIRSRSRLHGTEKASDRLQAALRGEGASENLPEMLAQFDGAMASLAPDLDPTVATDPPTIADLFDETFEVDWLFPGLMGRAERAVISAGEGIGKSALSTQIGIAGAAGIHPFTGESIGRPLRVVLIDCENSRGQTQRRYRWIGDRIDYAGGQVGWAKRITPYIRPEFLDLAGADRGWFHRAVASASPDLIVIGPAYKLMKGRDPNSDKDVGDLLAVLDEVRVLHDASILLEIHTPHAKTSEGKREVRPRGSSVWLGWPEVGVGLRRSDMDAKRQYATELELVHWRGMREERNWPDLLSRSKEPELPWSPTRPDYAMFSTGSGAAA